MSAYLYADSIQVNKGECIDFELAYTDPMNLTGIEVRVCDANSAGLAKAVITKTDEVNGKCQFHLSKENAASLRMGKTNCFRVELLFPNGCNDVTPLIWITVI